LISHDANGAPLGSSAKKQKISKLGCFTPLPTVGVGLTADCASRLIPPVQPSVALESYLEEVKLFTLLK